jgi:hypothetical protein
MVTIQGVNFYSVEETAQATHISKKALYNSENQTNPDNAKRRFTLSAVKSPGGRKFFREDEIITLLSESWGIRVTPEALRKELDVNKKSPIG